MLKKTTLASLVAIVLGLTACVQTPVRSGNLGIVGQLMNINGVAAYSGGSFDLGRFDSLPRMRTSQDFSALSRVIQGFREATAKHANDGNYEAALLANHFATKFVDYQSSLAGASKAAIQSLLDNGNGKVDLPAGAYAVLPAFDRYEEPSVKFSFNDWPYGPAHQLAANDLATKLDVANGIINAVVGQPAQRQPRRGGTKLGLASAMSLPLNQPITLTNGAVLERTQDSFILHNPGTGPVRVDVQQLGYLPPIRTPSQARKIAGQILDEMNRTFSAPVLTGQVKETNIEPPNKILFTINGQVKPGGLHIEGRLSKLPEEVIASKKEYEKSGSPFRLAVDARYGMERSKERNDFRSQCLAMGRNSPDRVIFIDLLNGAYGEIVNLKCMRQRYQGDPDGEMLYSRRFYVTDSGQVKSWESLLRDQDTVKKLKDLDQTIEARENLLQLLPIIGNLESGLKCTDTTSLARRFAMAFDENTQIEKQRAFVGDLYTPSDPSAWEKASNCAAALPLLGYGAQMGLSAAKLASLGKHVDQFGKPFVSAMTFFEDSLMARKEWDAIAATLPLQSQKTLGFAKTVYDTLQRGKNLSDLADALVFFGNRNGPAFSG